MQCFCLGMVARQLVDRGNLFACCERATQILRQLDMEFSPFGLFNFDRQPVSKTVSNPIEQTKGVNRMRGNSETLPGKIPTSDMPQKVAATHKMRSWRKTSFGVPLRAN